MFFVCCSSIVIPLQGPASIRRKWLFVNVCNIIDTKDRESILSFIYRLHASDRILYLAVDLFHDDRDILENCLDRFLNQTTLVGFLDDLCDVIAANEINSASGILKQMQAYRTRNFTVVFRALE